MVNNHDVEKLLGKDFKPKEMRKSKTVKNYTEMCKFLGIPVFNKRKDRNDQLEALAVYYEITVHKNYTCTIKYKNIKEQAKLKSKKAELYANYNQELFKYKMVNIEGEERNILSPYIYRDLCDIDDYLLYIALHTTAHTKKQYFNAAFGRSAMFKQLLKSELETIQALGIEQKVYFYFDKIIVNYYRSFITRRFKKFEQTGLITIDREFVCKNHNILAFEDDEAKEIFKQTCKEFGIEYDWQACLKLTTNEQEKYYSTINERVQEVTGSPVLYRSYSLNPGDNMTDEHMAELKETFNNAHIQETLTVFFEISRAKLIYKLMEIHHNPAIRTLPPKHRKVKINQYYDKLIDVVNNYCVYMSSRKQKCYTLNDLEIVRAANSKIEESFDNLTTEEQNRYLNELSSEEEEDLENYELDFHYFGDVTTEYLKEYIDELDDIDVMLERLDNM